MLKLFTYMVAWWWSIDIEYPATVKSFCTLKFALNMDIEQQTWIRGAFYIHAKEGGVKVIPFLFPISSSGNSVEWTSYVSSPFMGFAEF